MVCRGTDRNSLYQDVAAYINSHTIREINVIDAEAGEMIHESYMLDYCKQHASMTDINDVMLAIPYTDQYKQEIDSAMAACCAAILKDYGYLEMLYEPLKESEITDDELQEKLDQLSQDERDRYLEWAKEAI